MSCLKLVKVYKYLLSAGLCTVLSSKDSEANKNTQYLPSGSSV